ncbi:unnamed protein product [Hyaloperonospora brassicae]|uniref:Uncharacterized protein n=1 Tax=Hyaloperonospora brassicae TaxID=162125 RepID=A0AAV0U7M6_HYABA|nr:unnamed protein product [Hyaloperonospora brassicae]
MQQSRGRRLTPQDHEEDERVVYCGLETDSHSRSLLLSRDDASSPVQSRHAATAAKTKAARDGQCCHRMYPRHHLSLFDIVDVEDSEDEAGAEKSNPFESLLLQQQTTRQTEVAEVPPEAEMSVSWNDVGTGYMESSRIKATGDQSKKTEENRDSGRMSSFKKISSHSCENEETSCLRPKSMQESEEFTTRFRSAGDKKKLGFEAAESRPARWSSRKPSAVDTKNRRKSLSGIQRQRLQVEANVAKRRKSMPVNLLDPHVSHNRASEDEKFVMFKQTQLN